MQPNGCQVDAGSVEGPQKSRQGFVAAVDREPQRCVIDGRISDAGKTSQGRAVHVLVRP